MNTEFNNVTCVKKTFRFDGYVSQKQEMADVTIEIDYANKLYRITCFKGNNSSMDIITSITAGPNQHRLYYAIAKATVEALEYAQKELNF